jgi:hypothetical protein
MVDDDSRDKQLPRKLYEAELRRLTEWLAGPLRSTLPADRVVHNGPG